jgi:hypothetical protein
VTGPDLRVSRLGDCGLVEGASVAGMAWLREIATPEAMWIGFDLVIEAADYQRALRLAKEAGLKVRAI